MKKKQNEYDQCNLDVHKLIYSKHKTIGKLLQDVNATEYFNNNGRYWVRYIVTSSQ